MKAHWLLWGPVAIRTGLGSPVPHMLMTWLHDNRDPDDVYNDVEVGDEEWATAVSTFLGNWSWLGSDIATNGSELGGTHLPVGEEQAARLAEGSGIVAQPVSNTNRYVHALWLLLGQTIVTVDDEPIDRATARRARRMNLPGRVTVIQLRRSENAAREPGESMVEWQHRWLVRRHWRWQSYGPRKAEHVHALRPAVAEGGKMVRRCIHDGCERREVRIIIEGYVKGPEDKPLMVTDKVYSLER